MTVPALRTRPDGLTVASVLDGGVVSAADLVRPVSTLPRRAVPPLPVAAALEPVLPDGLRRGSTVSVAGSVSLVLALLGAPSADGAWCALVGLPAISAEAAAGYGIELSRLALIPTPGSGWVTAVGALLDAVDVVVVRPPARVSDGDVRRLAARARSRDAVLMPYLGGRGRWPGAEVTLGIENGAWSGLGVGHGRLHARQVTVTAGGRWTAARPRRTSCWLPARGGGIATGNIATGDIATGDIATGDIATGDIAAVDAAPLGPVQQEVPWHALPQAG